MPHALRSLSSNVPATIKKKPAAESANPTTSRSRQPMVGADSVSRPEYANITTTMTASMPKPTRQLRNVVRKPPKSGPTVAATEPIATQIPNANARSSPSYVAEMNAAVAGNMSAAPHPSSSDQPKSSMGALRLNAAIVVPTP